MVPAHPDEHELRGKAKETPAYFNKEVKNFKDSIKTMNKKLKAGSFASWISKWKEITSVKWVLSTVTDTNIEFEDITQIFVSQMQGKT